MSCRKSSWRIQSLLACVWLGASLCACKDAPAKADKEIVAAASHDAMPSAPVPKPLDPSFVPAGALAELEDIELEANSPCSATVESLRPIFQSVASAQQKLAAARDVDTGLQLLSALSAELRGQLPTLPVRTESDELRRISAELSASLGDLAESLQLAADALRADDKQAAATTARRIQNGVANTRSSIEGLIRQCAL